MAGNQKAIKLRIKSVQSTMQICKAMELVAASRLHKAMERAENSRPYFEALQGTLAQIAAENIDMMSIYTKEPQNDDWCFIVIAGDRGFAGGYNNNLFRLVEEQMEGHEACVLPIGKKALEHFSNRKVPVVSDSFTEAGDISVADCFEIARLICHGYKEGGFGHVAIVYTNFVNMMVQEPKFIPILPLPDMKSLLPKDAPEIKKRQIIYEPNSEAVFNAIVPEYLAGLIYGAMSESVASELASRRMMMDAATKNAQEMIDKLNLHYNRVRQAGITQESTEIVAGSES